MKSRLVPVLVGALAMALIGVAAGATAGGRTGRPVRIPNGSIGLKKLTPNLRQLVTTNSGKGGPHRPVGPQGPAGLPGTAGAVGAKGESASGKLLTYSAVGGDGQPLVLTREDGSTQESIGPLTFSGSCELEGEDTIRGKLEVTSSENGVTLNGKALNQGVTRTIQELTVSGGGQQEDFFPVIRATNEGGSFALQGVPSILVELPGGCHFYGTLIEDS